MKISIKEISKMKNGLNSFVSTIYNNFIHLSKIPQLEHNQNEIIKLLTSPSMISYVAYHDTQIIAYIIGEIKHLNDGRIVYYISYLYIGNKYRDMKLGTKLMNLIINKCKTSNINSILLTCDILDNRVTNFYKRIGFTPDPILQNFTNHEVFMKTI
jgi:ribosomal protein S18 acetylase RimI-like enzyme